MSALQVRAVLHRVLDILRKCYMHDHAAVWTSFAFDTVLCNNDPFDGGRSWTCRRSTDVASSDAKDAPHPEQVVTR